MQLCEIELPRWIHITFFFKTELLITQKQRIYVFSYYQQFSWKDQNCQYVSPSLNTLTFLSRGTQPVHSNDFGKRFSSSMLICYMRKYIKSTYDNIAVVSNPVPLPSAWPVSHVNLCHCRTVPADTLTLTLLLICTNYSTIHTEGHRNICNKTQCCNMTSAPLVPTGVSCPSTEWPKEKVPIQGPVQEPLF